MAVIARSARSAREAYSTSGSAWQAGPGRIYDRLAEVLVDRVPGGVRGRRVLDLGAGTGAASRAALGAGAATVVAVDLAFGMLRHDAGNRPPAAVADALRLPLADRSVGAIVAAFSLNHVTDPASGLVEAARVLARGGGLVASAYAPDDTHPAKRAVEAACVARGWTPEPWFAEIRSDAVPRLATVERAAEAAAPLPGAAFDRVRVEFPDLAPRQLVEWRLGMAQVASFVVALSPGERRDLVDDALDRLGPTPPVLIRSFVTIAWRKAS